MKGHVQMGNLLQELLSKVFKNYESTANPVFTLEINEVDSNAVNYRNAFRQLSEDGLVILHFDNESTHVDALTLLSYEYEITDKGLYLAQQQMKK